MEEQRKAQRYDLKLPFELVRKGPTLAGETCNLSSTGVLFNAGAELAVGEIVEYLITLPTAVRLRCVGKVVRFSKDAEVAATLERHQFIRNSR